MNPPTPKQARVLDMIRAYRIEHGHSPSMPEVADALGLSLGTISGHVARLIAGGHLARAGGPHARRSLMPTDAMSIAAEAERAVRVLRMVCDAGTGTEMVEAQCEARRLLADLSI